MYGNKNRKRNNTRGGYVAPNNFKKHRSETSQYERYKGKRSDQSPPYRREWVERRDAKPTLSRPPDHLAEKSKDFDEMYMGPSDDVYDAAYGEESQTNKKASFMQIPPPSTQFPEALRGDKKLYKDPIKETIMKIVDHCKKNQPIVYAANCSLYPPAEISIKLPPAIHSQGGHTVLVSNLPPLADEEMVRDIFNRCGKIEFICEELLKGKNEGEHARFCYRIEFKETNSALIAVQYNDHILCAGNPDSVMMPEMLSKIQVEFAIDSCPPVHQKDAQFSELNISKMLSLLRNKEQLHESSRILVNWMLSGQCTPYNVDLFLELIANVNSFVALVISANYRLRFTRDKYREDISSQASLIRGDCKCFFSFSMLSKYIWLSTQNRVGIADGI